MTDDSHIFDIFKAKFTDYKNFHTQLYTCAKEFDFLEYETYVKLSQTCLIPAVIIVWITLGLVVVYRKPFNAIPQDKVICVSKRY